MKPVYKLNNTEYSLLESKIWIVVVRFQASINWITITSTNGFRNEQGSKEHKSRLLKEAE
jgi:hypothetical protein